MDILQKGIVSAAQCRAGGLSYTDLSRLVKSGDLARVAHGVYETVDAPYDELYIEQLRRPKAVYSHGTALYLHDLTDRDPINLSVTVPAGYNTKALINDGFKVFSIKRELYETDIIQTHTKYGNPVNTYSIERTICDVVRSRNRIEAEIVSTALKRYIRRKDRNIPRLVRTAEQFGIVKLIRTYLEVLL